MEKVSTKHYRAHPILLLSFIILIGTLYSTVTRASTATQPPGQQIAYFIGYHSSPGYVYHRPNYNNHYHPRKLYWSGWRYVGHGCRKNCLVDRWNGHVVRCNRVCH